MLMTPYEKLKSLPNTEQLLQSGIFLQQLGALIGSVSDNDAAASLNEARASPFRLFSNRSKLAA
jgi:hypothetical protein